MSTSDPGAAGWAREQARQRLAQRWAEAVAGTSFVGYDGNDLVAFLGDLVDRLARLLTMVEEPDRAAARQIGVDMIAAHFTDTTTLARTLEILTAELPRWPAPAGLPPEVVSGRIAAVVGAVAAGYAAALRNRVLDEQEQIRRAAVQAYRLSEQRVAAGEARFRTVFTEAAVGIGIGDLAGNIWQVNPALMKMFGYTAEEFTRRNVAQMMHPDDAPDIWPAYAELAAGRRDYFRVEKRFFRADGAVIWTQLSVSLVRDEYGAPAYQVAMLHDVTEQQRLRQSLEHMAYHDPLTGLANRARLAQRLAELFDAPCGAARVGMCFLDLDGFKTINDRLGHDCGDQLLVAVADRLQQCCRPHMVARMGGDEFVVLVADTAGIGQVVTLARRILADMAAPIDLGHHQVSLTTSIGIVEHRLTDTSPDKLLAAADQTLYRAKAHGRARYAVYDDQRPGTDIIAAAPATPTTAADNEVPTGTTNPR